MLFVFHYKKDDAACALERVFCPSRTPSTVSQVKSSYFSLSLSSRLVELLYTYTHSSRSSKTTDALAGALRSDVGYIIG